jgi:acyl-[acyl-carrier-protein]-phospholipid O-acyltransferase/long-chain-fatty-acid--[acyl-carrier-protein] ligase
MFVRRAKRFSRRACISDGTTPMMTFGQTLMRTIILSRLLRRKLADTRFVGIFLPPSVGAVLANLSVSGLGRIPVNLNYTVGLEVLDNCITQCGIRQVITSRQFTEKIKLEPHAELVFLEDLRSQVGTSDKFSGLVGRFLPAGLVTRLFFDVRQIAMDELATVIFSSGSTGIPKGVMLTHHNIISNIESVVQTVDCTERDRVMGVLPLFHSFGYTVSMWLPLRIGASAVYHYSPLEAEVIGKMVREQQATIFLSTATFLRNYIRKCGADDFRSVRIIMCGAEKLPMQVADQFERKFGIRPLEGYGCTELSPAVSANRPDVERRGGRQVGHKPGTIGHPMPGIAVRIAHPETLEPLPIGQEGLLLVKGPNVMKGYLNRPDLTAEAIRDGWYCTGDIARLDEDGFLTITDRISRFSKIGGEMVPHAKIENEIHRILDTHEQLCVVVGVPDERKGERLVVIHVPLPISVDELWHKLSQSGLPPLWIPSRSAFFEVSNLLVLGSGKLDLKGIKAIAHQKLAG